MRTLLIDNYDSFTYNLFHYLTETQGHEPEVVVNDDPRWRATYLAEFDNVVLSPGPGHPNRPGDFGICRDVITVGGLPILGVCLGHQGLAALHGAPVRRAPYPCHGRVNAVHHDGSELFAGIPAPFDAVRYHSLVAEELPATLAATAWTGDGLIMGLRHLHLPQWGVQFHPESAASTYGHRLLANFRELTKRHGRPRQRVRRVSSPRPEAPRPEPAPRLRVLVRDVPLHWTAEAAYEALFLDGDHAYWLDSGCPGADSGRFSIMGDGGGPLARVATADVPARTVTVRSRTGTTTVDGDFLDWLERDLATMRTTAPGIDCSFTLGWAGYLGYELKAECGGRRTATATEPGAVLVFSDRALVVDHETGTACLLALARDGDDDTTRAATGWLDEAAGRLAGLVGRTHPEPEPVPGGIGEPWMRHDRDTYLKLIAECLREITAGEGYEICLTTAFEADGDPDPWQGYRLLRRLSPAPYAAFLQFGDIAVLSSSPERFLQVGPDRVVRSSPIKGTRPRGETAQQDRALADELRRSDKDRAENLMIVDLVRNDLGRGARAGSVTVPGLFEVQTYAMAHQLVSTVSAQLRPDVSTVACVRAAFPPGSMTGAPKRRVMDILDGLEGGPRGVYSGAIGYFSLTGAADLNVVIRTAVLTPGRVGYGVGGAVIALSDPGAEFDEILVKSRPLWALAGAGPRRGPDGVPAT
ncbi:aminodeoxychorismate synthase component I [Micromonospora sp. SCSIO 07396]